MIKRIITVLLLLSISADYLKSQDTGSGLDFLNIGPYAQILAMGEGTVAIPTGSSSIYSNPSLLSFEERDGLQVNYSLWIANVNTQFAALHVKRNRFTVGLGVYGTQAGNFEARQQPGPSTGTFSISYFSLSGAAAYQLGPLSFGVTGQYLREEIFQFRANGYAFNFGSSARFYQNRITAGISVNNIGKMEELDSVSSNLPALLKAGISLQLIEFNTPGENDLPVLLSTFSEWSRPLESEFRGDFIDENADNDYMTIGVNADIADLFEIHSAYRFGPTERPYSFGMGLLINPIKVHYAFVPFSTGYGTAHSFGLHYFFN